MARASSLDLRERVVAAAASGQSCPLGGQDVCGRRRQRCEVVAAPARARQSGGAERAATGPTLWRESAIRFWRGSPRPDLTLRALLRELADRGLVVS